MAAADQLLIRHGVEHQHISAVSISGPRVTTTRPRLYADKEGLFSVVTDALFVITC
jgi:hypothetical protein